VICGGVLSIALVVLATSVPDPPRRDSDSDGIPDRIEDRNRDGQINPGETDPRRRDSDRDGVPDGVEDRDHDGRVDPDESDPRVPGLFPGTGPHIPEPLAFDMVRGLGARAGEVEVNTLLLPRWSGGALTLDWAPEIEWAPRDDLAIEVELPMHGGQLHALKSAIQGTLARRSRRFVAGWQVLGELLPGESKLRTTALALAGWRLSRRWSALGMSGVRMDWTRRPADVALALLLNPSVFADLGERLTVGVEHNLAVGLGGSVEATLLPQFHFQLSRRLRLQCGLGAHVQARRFTALGGLRLVLER
jgi:hypothetical protein